MDDKTLGLYVAAAFRSDNPDEIKRLFGDEPEDAIKEKLFLRACASNASNIMTSLRVTDPNLIRKGFLIACSKDARLILAALRITDQQLVKEGFHEAHMNHHHDLCTHMLKVFPYLSASSS